jgi:hypothetical protein
MGSENFDNVKDIMTSEKKDDAFSADLNPAQGMNPSDYSLTLPQPPA